MWNSVSARWRHFTALWKERVLARWVGLVYSLAALYVFVRDEIWHPKNADQWGIINMIPSLSLGWWIAGAFAIICFWIFESSFRLMRRQESRQAEEDNRIKQLEQTQATLVLSGPHLHNDHRFKNKNHWRMNVHNAGPAAARNVQMKLRRGASEPKDSNWTSDYPYPVYPVGTIKNDPKHIAAIGRQINANDDEGYEISCCWKAGNNQFFTDINTRGGGHNDIRINSGERWNFLYEVVAENASPIRFVLEFFIENDDEVKVVKVI
jgi:hypothetical protein